MANPEKAAYVVPTIRTELAIAQIEYYIAINEYYIAGYGAIKVSIEDYKQLILEAIRILSK